MSNLDVAPRVSVVMANHNGATHIGAAVRSVLAQTEASLELIISDDGSSDASLDVARAAASSDPRLIIIRNASRGGPGAARNRALSSARGRWIAIVDNDDFIHPQRLQRLIGAAEADGADIAADDLLVFYEDLDKAPHPHLRGRLARSPTWIDAAAYENSNLLLRGGASLGYLKPVFRRSLGCRYNESLRIGEDSDLILRLLIAGARMRLYPDLGYFYRKHARSISHRLDRGAIEAMEQACAAIDPAHDIALARALSRGRSARADAAAFTDLTAALKARHFGAAMGAALRRPSALPLLRSPIAARLFRAKPRRSDLPGKRVTILSRQRILGATNGSSAYVLALAGALKDAGYRVDYLAVSPKTFGRWAWLRLRPETRVFDRYLVHGGLRLGSLVFARDPARWLASALAVVEHGLGRLGFPALGWTRAEYAQAAPATRADQVFVARRAARGLSAVFCDYAFLAPIAAYALAPGSPSLTIMHDLMSARVGDPAAERNPAEVDALTSEVELGLLGLTDAVIAIQQEEAARVRAALPGRIVIIAPHAARLAPAPQPGVDDTLLFVGSNTAPNVVGLEWFFSEVWPALRAMRPKAALKIAGSVSRALGRAPEGVAVLGVVHDLTPHYAEAGVVISPLYTGSGLKIKLVEALAAGKAVVATSVTLQGVEAETQDAVAHCDAPDQFAACAAALLASRERRAALAAAALDCARAHFSAGACFHDMISFVQGGFDAAPAQKALRATAAPSQ